MQKKNLIVVCILIFSMFLSSCSNRTNTPSPSHPTTIYKAPDSETLAIEKTSTGATLEQMYPVEGSQVVTTYPAWENQTIKLQDLRPPSEANVPISGRASISGLLYAYNISVPLSCMNFILMPAVISDGVAIVPPILTYGNPEDGDIMGKTDGDGVFYLDDILPGQYFFVVNYPDHSEIAVDPNNTAKPYLLEFKADTSYPLGIVMILG